MTNKEAIERLKWVKKRISDITYSPESFEALDIAVKALKERPHGEWIPVSERLPEEEDYRPCYGLPDGCVMWQTDNGDIGFGWYYRSTECWSDLNDNPIKTGKVIAWQPLPRPYKEADNE